jgi:two-component system LytT family response regulator
VYSQNEIPFPILYCNDRLENTKSGVLILDKGQRFLELDLNNIIRIESHALGSTVFMVNKAFWTTGKLIDQFEAELKLFEFLRVHASHLINMRYIERFVRCDAFITLSTSDAIPVDSKSNEHIAKYLEDKQII